MVNTFWRTGILKLHGYAIPFHMQDQQDASMSNIFKRRRIEPPRSPDRLPPRSASVDTVYTGVAPVRSPSSPTAFGFPVAQQLAFVDQGRPEIVTAQPSAVGSALGLPDAKHLASVFPDYMCRSIAVTGAKAEVELTPSQNADSSCLKLSIYSTRVQHFTKELFGVNIENEGGQMFVRFKDTGASAPIDTLRIVGAWPEALKGCFGPEITAAIQTSPRYSTELARGQKATDCVSIVIQGYTGLYSFLRLESDPHSFSTIVARLWPAGNSL